MRLRSPFQSRDWMSDEYARDLSARIPGRQINAWFAANPTADILIHAPGGDAVMICARYGSSPQPPDKWRARMRIRSAHRGEWFGATDVRAWVPWIRRPASLYPRDLNRLLWTAEGVHSGYLTPSPDYQAIGAAVELIRSIHGCVPVEWSISFPAPDWLAPIRTRGALLLITDEFDK